MILKKKELKKKYIRLSFNFKGFHEQLFKDDLNKIRRKAQLMNIFIKGVVYLPTIKKRVIVLKSPHVYKKSREQFELKTYNRALVVFFEYTEDNKKKAKIFVNFVKNCSAGFKLKITYKTMFLNK